MYLLFDLSQKDTIHLALFDESTIHEKEFPGRNKELLFCLDQLLQEHSLNKNNVQGIMVVVGSGGFTSTRLSVTVANTFAYTLQIPVLAITEVQSKIVQDLIPELAEQPKGQFVSATYSGEANIGAKKMVL